MTTPIPTALSDGPFTLAEAAEHGISRKVLRGSRFVQLFPRTYVRADLEVTAVQLVQAAQLSIGHHAIASHESGLQAWGVDIGSRGSVHLTIRTAYPIRITGITVHRSQFLGTIHDVQSCRVLSPERCLVDTATRRQLADLVVAGDWLIHRGHLTPESFHAFVHDHHFDGIVRARRVAELILPGAKSPRESIVRMMLVLAGLPTPECNITYGNEHEPLARLDLSYREWKVAIEYDGRQHGLSLAQRERDVRRREAMERDGWVFIVVTAAQLRNPRAIVIRVHHAIATRGYRGPLPEYGREWQQSFGRG